MRRYPIITSRLPPFGHQPGMRDSPTPTSRIQTFGPIGNEALPYHHQPPITFRSPADNEGQTNYHRPPAPSNYHHPREKANGRKATYFSMKAGKGRSAIPTVKYIEHPNFKWLPMKENMSLDEAFRAIHNTQDLPAGADQIISSFKEEYADRCAAGFWAFWEEDRIRAGFSPCVFANHLRDIWRLTRYCGYKIRLLDADADAVVRLATLEEDPHQLGVTIFYQHDDTKMYKQRYIDHHYGQEHDIDVYCDLESCECKDQGHAL